MRGEWWESLFVFYLKIDVYYFASTPTSNSKLISCIDCVGWIRQSDEFNDMQYTFVLYVAKTACARRVAVREVKILPFRSSRQRQNGSMTKLPEIRRFALHAWHGFLFFFVSLTERWRHPIRQWLPAIWHWNARVERLKKKLDWIRVWRMTKRVSIAATTGIFLFSDFSDFYPIIVPLGDAKRTNQDNNVPCRLFGRNWVHVQFDGAYTK